MPNAAFIPAELNDLSVDVTLTSPARGDVLYRGASKWNNLAAGTSGKFLQSNGAGADPGWATVPAADLTTVPLLAPSVADRNLIQPAANGVTGLSVKAKAGGGAYIFDVQNSIGTPLLKVADVSVDSTLTLFAEAANTALYLQMDTGSTAAGLILDTTNVGFHRFNPTGEWLYFLTTSAPPSTAEAVRTSPTFADNTDGATKGRYQIFTYDGGGANAREVLRGEASGTAPMIGFLGAAAVVRPVATTDLRQGLIDLGLYTTGGATPLNLNGGVFTTTGSGNALGRTTFTGAVAAPEVATSANTTLDGTHFSIFENTTGGNKTVTLPTAVAIAGRIYCIKNTGTGVNTLTVATTSAQTIDGAAGASTSTPQACLILQSDGANWQTLSIN